MAPEAQKLDFHVTAGQIPEEKNSPDQEDVIDHVPPSQHKNYKKLLRVIAYTLFVLVTQSGATLFGRVYYDKGGKSIWLATLRQTIAFPILIPFSLYLSPPKHSSHSNQTNLPSFSILATVYTSLGVILALHDMLYSIGLLYLPVSTYSLITATQLAFNVIFSFFLNAQKLTPPIINSVVLLTISSTLVVLQTGSENSKNTSSKKYTIGIISTVFASALFSLSLSLTQVFFQKVLKRQNLHAALNIIIYQSCVATCISIIALFVSKEGNGLKREMEEFELGKVSYVMLSVGISVAWQVFTIGAIGLIFEVSSLFSNVVGALGLPIVPILAVIFLHDKMNGVKIISLILSLWGFASYIYEQYLDRSRSQTEIKHVIEVSEIVTSQ